MKTNWQGLIGEPINMKIKDIDHETLLNQDCLDRINIFIQQGGNFSVTERNLLKNSQLMNMKEKFT